jgi:heat shock protein HtpX
MAHGRRHDLFPADRGLQARMVLAAVGTPLVVVALLVAVAVLLPIKVIGGIAVLLAIGIVGLVRERRKIARATVLGPGEGPELHAVVQRLCLVADLPAPEIAVEEDTRPNSWIVDLPGRPPRLHVTRGLLDLLEPAELEAVVAHELSHVAHRDATVMTVVALPSALLLKDEGSEMWMSGMFVFARGAAMIIGVIGQVGSSALSRYRELTADAGAAALTGHPAALASALMKVSGALAAVPSEDLRVVAGTEALHLVAEDDEDAWGFARTHPSVERRVAALERLEHRMAHGRRAL